MTTTNSDPANNTTQKYVELFKGFRVGESCFVPDVAAADLEFLRPAFKRAGLGVRILRVEEDEIFLSPGVRIFREAGEFDEL